MDDSSASAAGPDPTSEYEAARRRSKIGNRLALAGFATAFAVLMMGIVLFSRNLDGMDRVPPGQSASIELEEGTYLIYDESSPAAQVEVVGDAGPVELGAATVTATVSRNDVTVQATHSIDIDEPGTYQVQNNGNGRIYIGPPIDMRIFGLMVAPFVIGFLAVGIGFFMVINGYLSLRRTMESRRSSNSRRRRTPHTTHHTARPETEPDDSASSASGPQDDVSPQPRVGTPGDTGPQDDLSSPDG